MIRELASVLFVLSVGSVLFPSLAHAQQNWQANWDKTLKAAEQEGRVAYSGCGSHDYLAEFQKKFAKIKLESVSAPCAELTARIMAERRAGKYLHDVVRLGLTSAHTFHRAKLLQPISAAFILPEVIDLAKWWQKKHHYSDAEGKYLFVPPPASIPASPAITSRR
jgi:hypothetical protein